MKQASEQRPDRVSERARAKRRAMIKRRVIGVLVAILAVGIGVLVRFLGLSLGTLIMGAAAALMLLASVVLWVNLPVPRWVFAVLAVLCFALAVGGFTDHFFVKTEEGPMPRYAVTTQMRVTDRYPFLFDHMMRLEELDMRGSTVTDFAPIREIRSLKRLDIRENYAFDQAEHDALAAALPGCSIRWSVPIHEMYFDSEASSVDVTSLNLTVAELRTLLETYPEKRFNYCVPLLGTRYALDTESMDLQGAPMDVNTIHAALSLLPSVRSVDLRGTPATAEEVSALCNSHPQVDFAFTCQVPSGTITTEDTALSISGSFEDLMAYVAFFDYMPNLVSVDARGVLLTEDQADILLANVDSQKLLYTFEAFGRKMTNSDTELNLDNAPVPSVDAMERCLAKMPNLVKVSMCDCGLSEDEMGQLFDAHPEIKFIFWIEFGHYRLRTDATAFTTALGTGNQYGYNDDTFKALRYCTDLKMLDLGHNHITSLENFEHLTKLRVLIMADNKLTNIAEIANFKDLEYLELFLNDITDLTPLTELKKLMDLNIFYNPIYDNYKPLKSIPTLKRLWIGGCRLSNAQLADLQKALPTCKINVEGHGSTSKGWRKHSHYDTLVQMYETGQYIPFEDSNP